MKKITFLIGFAVSTLVANAQALIGVNSKLNRFSLGVDANGIGYYGFVSYGEVKQGTQSAPFRFDYIAPELHPNAKHYDIANVCSTEKNTSLTIGKILNNDDDLRVGVNIGVNINEKQYFNNYNDKDLGSFSILASGETKNTLVGGFYFNYYILWANVNVNTNKELTANFGLFIPLVYEKNCLK